MQKLHKKKKQSKLKTIVVFISFICLLGIAGGIEQCELDLFPGVAMATIASIIIKICLNEE